MSVSVMAKEARETPNRMQEQQNVHAPLLMSITNKIKQFDPKLVMIIGRGSSDHAGVFAKYLIETEICIPVASAAPSISTVFDKTLRLDSALVICISQSGKSPDILNQVERARSSGALCLAIVNDTKSPLAQLCDMVLPICAGEELAVAATKSFLCTLSAITRLVAHWHSNDSLKTALVQLPKQLETVINAPCQIQLQHLKELKYCVVLGRGFAYAISREVALKLKEVCGIHAESFSSAEFLHGPITLISKALITLNITIEDETASFHQAQIDDVKSRGGKVIDVCDTNLLNGVHPRLQALIIMQRFYLDIEAVATQMGYDPDKPIGLNKVTKTL